MPVQSLRFSCPSPIADRQLLVVMGIRENIFPTCAALAVGISLHFAVRYMQRQDRETLDAILSDPVQFRQHIEQTISDAQERKARSSARMRKALGLDPSGDASPSVSSSSP